MKILFDAYAILTWLQDEAGAEQVETILNEAEEGKHQVYLSIINLGEVYYRLHRVNKGEEAERLLYSIKKKEFPFEVVPVTNRRVLAAAKLKAIYPFSYADAFAASLARELQGGLVTGDPEFKPLEANGYIQILWLP